MKIAVFALICMYVLIQCGNTLDQAETSKLYNSIFPARKFLTPQSLASSSSQYYNQKIAYRPEQNYLHTLASINGRKMIVPLPVPILQVPYKDVSSTAYNTASHRNQHTYNYQQYGRRSNKAVSSEEPIEEIQYDQTVPTCDNKRISISEEEPEADMRIERNVDIYRKEMCHYIVPKANALLMNMSTEEASYFMNDFVFLVDKYCDFANLGA